MADPAKPLDAVGQDAKELVPVAIAKKDGRVTIATRGNVVYRSRKINSQWAAHDLSLAIEETQASGVSARTDVAITRQESQ